MSRTVAVSLAGIFLLACTAISYPNKIKAQTYEMVDDATPSGAYNSYQRMHSSINSSMCEGILYYPSVSHVVDRACMVLKRVGTNNSYLGKYWFIFSSGYANKKATSESYYVSTLSTTASYVCGDFLTPYTTTTSGHTLYVCSDNFPISNNYLQLEIYQEGSNVDVKELVSLDPRLALPDGGNNLKSSAVRTYKIIATPTPSPSASNFTHFELASKSASGISDYFKNIFILMVLMLITAGIYIGIIIYKK